MAEWKWVSVCAVLLVVLRLVTPLAALRSIEKGSDVYAFLAGMMLIAEMSRGGGVFEWLAACAVRVARGSRLRLFMCVYGIGTFVTIVLSNDATAVVLTPAVAAAARRARVEPLPHLFACALVANAASFVLPISNPANLVVFGGHVPPLGRWLAIFLGPSLAAIAATYAVLWMVWRAELRGTFRENQTGPSLSIGGRVAACGIVFSAVALVLASARGWSLGTTTLFAAIAVACGMSVANRTVVVRSLRGLTWSVVPLVAGLFVLADAATARGLLHRVIMALAGSEHAGPVASLFITAGGVALATNVANNLPTALIVAAATRPGHEALQAAVAIGIDLGPNLAVSGSLATLLWLVALRREGFELSAWRFLRVGAFAMPLALVCAVSALFATTAR